MEKENHLSENLKGYQKLHGCSLTEFSEELGVPKSTLQSVLQDGNTTLDTLMRIQQALEVTLDELVYGKTPLPEQDKIQALLRGLSRYGELSAEKQKKFRYHLNGLMEVLGDDRGETSLCQQQEE